jgi:uncharacterized protein YdeI (YjbR/CyaY-like superfamily)
VRKPATGNVRRGTLTFFRSPAAFRAWLERHHATRTEVVVGYHKRATGRPSLTWSESVDEALCFGWIDGVRRSIDDERYCIRFTPRKKGSNWSAVNVRKVAELTTAGRMRPAGLAAFERRLAEKSRIYSYEDRKTATLTPAHAKIFRANARAWSFFQTLPPSNRRTIAYWIAFAKKEETKLKRLERAIAACAARRRMGW